MNKTVYKNMIVKRLRLLQYLVDRGYTEYKIIPDPTTTKAGYNWFVFKNTPELQRVVDEYFLNLKNLKR